MRTVCVLCVYICTLTVSVQFSRGQPGNQSVQTVQTSPEPLPNLVDTQKDRYTHTHTDRSVYRVAPQLKRVRYGL